MRPTLKYCVDCSEKADLDQIGAGRESWAEQGNQEPVWDKGNLAGLSQGGYQCFLKIKQGHNTRESAEPVKQRTELAAKEIKGHESIRNKVYNQWKEVLNNMGITGAGARDILNTVPLHTVNASYRLLKAW